MADNDVNKICIPKNEKSLRFFTSFTSYPVRSNASDVMNVIGNPTYATYKIIVEKWTFDTVNFFIIIATADAKLFKAL